MDFPMDEADDVFYEQWESQVTDADPDPARRRASVHRGAAYLQDVVYPPHGSSHGQEGGSMRPQEEIEVFGAHDFGCDVLGAAPAIRATAVKAAPFARKLVSKGAPAALASKMAQAKVGVTPRGGFVAKKTPGGRTVTVFTPGKTKKSAQSVKNARDAAKRAIDAGNRLSKVADDAAKAQRAAPQAPTKPAVKTTVRGAVVARRPPARTVRRGAKINLPPAKLKALAKKALKAGADATAAASKLEQVSKANEARVAAGVNTTRKQTTFRGDVGDPLEEGYGEYADGFDLESVTEVLGALVEVLGEEAAAEAAVDPADPYGYIAAIGPAPTQAPPLQPGIDYVPDPGPEGDQTAYSSNPALVPGAPLPEGAVIYDGSRGIPGWGLGSWQLSYGRKRDGRRDGFALRTQSWWGGGVKHDAGWMAQHGESMDTISDDEAHTSKGPYVPQLQVTSVKKGWGPLVGSDDKGWTYGLRYDAGGDRWFWFYDTAKKVAPWATSADDAERLNKAVVDYKALYTAAVADTAAQVLADQLEARQQQELLKQQAAEDAATQRQIEQEQLAAQHQASLEAVQDDTEARRASLADQGALDYEQRQALIEDERMARQAEMQAALDERRAAAEEERMMRMADTQAQMEERRMLAEEERLMRMAEREAELAERFPQAAEPRYPEAYEEPSEPEGFYDEVGQPAYDLEEVPLEPLDSDAHFSWD